MCRMWWPRLTQIITIQRLRRLAVNINRRVDYCRKMYEFILLLFQIIIIIFRKRRQLPTLNSFSGILCSQFQISLEIKHLCPDKMYESCPPFGRWSAVFEMYKLLLVIMDPFLSRRSL